MHDYKKYNDKAIHKQIKPKKIKAKSIKNQLIVDFSLQLRLNTNKLQVWISILAVVSLRNDIAEVLATEICKI